ncbi:MAG: glycoside hydrolase family 125 protein [Ignavibacteriaceae bacterium]
MPSRREFLIACGLTVAALSLSNFSMPSILGTDKFPTRHPNVAERKFISNAVEVKIKEVKSKIKNEELAEIFENCFPNTLDTTVNFQMLNGKPDTFAITSDIKSMWLRDSSAQV